MKDLIITIGREFGSGGRKIGEEIAKKLDIKFYDNAIIDKAAESSGLSAEFIEKEYRITDLTEKQSSITASYEKEFIRNSTYADTSLKDCVVVSFAATALREKISTKSKRIHNIFDLNFILFHHRKYIYIKRVLIKVIKMVICKRIKKR